MKNVPLLTFAGASSDEALVLDLDRLITSRLLIQAASGGGKSRALRSLLEGTHGQVQQIVLDSEGEFASLREVFPFVLAGVDGDVVATPETAGLLARKLLELGASCVVNLYDLNPTDRRLYVRRFLEELMALPHELWRPLLVVLDEAHTFAPQVGTGTAQSAEAVIKLASQGRKRGFCLVAATQRLSKLHKDVAAELGNKLLGLTTLDVDVKRAADDLGFDKSQTASLKTLQPGEFFAYGPALSNQVTRVRTDDVRTSHPEAGKIGSLTTPAPAELREILAALADLPTQAQDEARTVEQLQTKLEQLQFQLRERPQTAPKRVEVRVEVPVVRDDQLAQLESQARQLVEGANALQGVSEEAQRVAGDILEKLSLFRQSQPGAAPETTNPQATPVQVKAGEGAEIPLSQGRLMSILAMFEAVQVPELSRETLALWCGETSDAPSFKKNLTALAARGHIVFPRGGYLALTPQGRSMTAEVDVPSTLTDYHQAWKGHLSHARAAILATIVAHYPKAMKRSELAQAVGQPATSGAFKKHLSDLKSLEVVTYPRQGEVLASRLLFPQGLR